MALPKQTVNIPFGGGIDTKTDRKQVNPVKVLNLENSTFDSPGTIKKRYGFDTVTVNTEFQNNDTIAEAGSLFVKNDELLMNARQTLTATGRTAPDDGWRFYSWAKNKFEWKDAGVLEPLEIEILQGMPSSELDIHYFDVAFCRNFYCYVYTLELLSGATRIYYSIYDADTQTIIHEAVYITTSYPDGLHVVTVGDSFHIYAIDATNNELGRTIIDTTSLETAPTTMTLLQGDVHGDGLFDVTVTTTVAGPEAVVAYKETGANQIRWRWYFEDGTAGFVVLTAETPVNVISVQELYDVTTAQDRIACTWQVVGGDIRSELRNPNSAVYTAARLLLSHGDIDARNITCVEDPSLDAAAPGATSTIRWYIEFENDIGAPYGGATPWYYYIYQVEDHFAGGAVAVRDRLRNAGLASKAFLHEGKARVWLAYDTTFQKSLFLTQARDTTSARYDARVLYMEGGGITYGPNLPQVVNPSGSSYLTTAVRQERLAAILEEGESEVVGEILRATVGVAVTFNGTFGGNALDRCELGPTLSVMPGGYVGDFDGRMQELNFHLFPEEIATDEINPGASNIPDGTYNYRCHYEWMDRKGQIHRSAVSPIYTGTVAAGPSTIRHWVPSIHKGEIDKLGGPTWAAGKTHTTRISIFREYTDGLYHKIHQSALTDNDTAAAYTLINDDTLDISGNEILYVTGGILEDYGPPETRIGVVRQNRMFIVPEEDRELIWYSKEKVEGLGIQFSPFLTRRISAGGEIMALAELDEKIIVFKRSEIHAFSGDGPNPTGAGQQFTDTFQVTSDVGCFFRQSVIKTDAGLLFQSEKGIHILTRGLEVVYIGAPVEAYNGVAVMKASDTQRYNRQVRFLMYDGSMLVYDHSVQQWATFTNALWTTGFLQDAAVWDGDWCYLDNTGKVREEHETDYTDDSTYIPLKVETAWIKLADLQGFYRIDWISLLGDWKSAHTLTVEIYTDYSPALVATKTITTTGLTYPYQNRFKMPDGYAKCEAVKLIIYDSDAGAGSNEGYSLSGIAIDYKVKKGLYKRAGTV